MELSQLSDEFRLQHSDKIACGSSQYRLGSKFEFVEFLVTRDKAQEPKPSQISSPSKFPVVFCV